MEKEGFIRCLENIQKKHKLQIEVVATDRHGQIRKLMRTDPRFNHIFHQFDPWHIAKGFVKKLTKASKKKGESLLYKLLIAIYLDIFIARLFVFFRVPSAGRMGPCDSKSFILVCFNV